MYVDAFLSVLRNVTKEETVQYVLALLAQMLAGGRLPDLARAPTPHRTTRREHGVA
jgi:hypothetical protein